MDEELNGNLAAAGPSGLSQRNGRGFAVVGHGHRSVKCAKASRVQGLCQRQGVHPDRPANERFQGCDLEELTIREGSTLIDELKAAPSRGRKGVGGDHRRPGRSTAYETTWASGSRRYRGCKLLLFRRSYLHLVDCQAACLGFEPHRPLWSINS